MGSEEYIHLTVGQCGENLLLLLGCNHSAQKPYLEREIMKTVLEVRVVLLGKNCGRSQESNLLSAHYGLESRPEGDFRLAVTYISADQTVHDMGTFHIVLHILDTSQLILGLVIFEFSLEPKLPVVVPVEGKALAVLASCVKGNQLACQFLRTLTGLGLLVLPPCRPELVDVGSLPCRAYVALDKVCLLDRNIEVLLVRELDLYVITLPHPVYLQEDTDTVVHMDDIVAFMQFHKAVQGRTLGVLECLYNLLLSPEDLALAEDYEAFASD